MAPPELTCVTTGGDMFGCMLEQGVVGLGGEAFAGVLLAGILWSAFYVLGRGYTPLPTAVTILAGAVFIPMLPGNLQGLSQVVMFMGFVSAIMVVARRYMMEGVR